MPLKVVNKGFKPLIFLFEGIMCNHEMLKYTHSDELNAYYECVDCREIIEVETFLPEVINHDMRELLK